MYKRISVRLVAELASALTEISKRKGLSINALISEIAWDFVEYWNTKYEKGTRSTP